MDPVAHTLIGATMAETGLKRFSRYAAPVLIIGANLPDLDAVANLWGRDTALYFRRGWSHGILAMLLLPLLLAGTVWAWHHWRGRKVIEAPPFHLGAIIALAFLAVWSHPTLDWLNTYGVRLLMPFSETWFYGDTLFIIDPWFWLLTAVAVVLAHSSTHRAIAGWILLAAATTIIVVGNTIAPPPVKVIWLLGVAIVVLIRWLRPTSGQVVARLGLATLVVYIGALYGLARLAESRVSPDVPAPLQAQANPVPGNPFSHRVVLVYDTHYHVVSADGERFDVPREPPNEIVRAAMQDESIRGFVTWMRYPYWEVEETGDAWKVRFRDLRYVDPNKPHDGIGIGRADVEVPKDTRQP